MKLIMDSAATHAPSTGYARPPEITGSEPRSINMSNRLPSALGGATYIMHSARAYATYRRVYSVHITTLAIHITPQ